MWDRFYILFLVLSLVQSHSTVQLPPTQTNFSPHSESDCLGLLKNWPLSMLRWWEEFCNIAQSKPEKVEIACENMIASVQRQSLLKKMHCENLIANSVTWLSRSHVPCPPYIAQLAAELQESLSLSLQYAELTDEKAWEFIGESGNIRVWKCKNPLSSSKEARKWPCVKTTTVIDAPPEFLVALFMDSSKIHLTNKYSMGRIDIEHMDASTKVVWNRSKIPFTPKQNDFSLLLHAHRFGSQGGFMIVSKSVDHPQIPESDEFSRSETFLGLSLLKPLPEDPTKTEITTINHVRVGGLPPILASRNFFHGSVGYFNQLKDVVSSLRKVNRFDSKREDIGRIISKPALFTVVTSRDGCESTCAVNRADGYLPRFTLTRLAPLSNPHARDSLISNKQPCVRGTILGGH